MCVCIAKYHYRICHRFQIFVIKYSSFLLILDEMYSLQLPAYMMFITYHQTRCHVFIFDVLNNNDILFFFQK